MSYIVEAVYENNDNHNCHLLSPYCQGLHTITRDMYRFTEGQKRSQGGQAIGSSACSQDLNPHRDLTSPPAASPNVSGSGRDWAGSTWWVCSKDRQTALSVSGGPDCPALDILQCRGGPYKPAFYRERGLQFLGRGAWLLLPLLGQNGPSEPRSLQESPQPASKGN